MGNVRPFFSCTDSADPGAAMLMRHNREMLDYLLEMPIVDGEDLRGFCARQRAVLGCSAQRVKQMLDVSVMLRRMPKVVEAARVGHVDLPRWCSMERQLSAVDDAHIEAVDLRVSEVLTPVLENENFPQARTLALRVRTIVEEECPEAVVPARAKPTPKATMRRLENGMFRLSATFDAIQGLTIYKAMIGRVKGKRTPENMLEALCALILDEVVTKLHLYGIQMPGDEAKVHLEGASLLSPDDAQRFLDEAARTIVTGCEETAAYAIPDSIRRFVIARDGTCRFPGCTVDASKCQLDHVTPFDDGGATTPANLHCLCQHHHTMKSEGLVLVSIDARAHCTWVLSDGRTVTTTPTGIWRDFPARTTRDQRTSVRGHTIAQDKKRRSQRGQGHTAAHANGAAGVGQDTEGGEA